MDWENNASSSLDRFKSAQDQTSGGFATALRELQAGRKTSHWIWYIFPQLAGLGKSEMAQRYALSGLDEACDYLQDPSLREHLRQASQAVADQLADGRNLRELMGSEIDARKLVSSLTLFQLAVDKMDPFGREPEMAYIAAPCEAVLAAAGDQGYPMCSYTQSVVAGKPVDL